MSRRRVEVVVWGLLAVVFGAFALTGIARLNESDKRQKCQINLKLFALGVCAYRDAHQRLPPLTDADAGLMSVLATLYPYTESCAPRYRPGAPAEAYNAHSSVEFVVHGKDPADVGTQHGGDANYPGTRFLDPSDLPPKGLRDIPMTLPNGTVGYYATGSYAANGLLPWGQKAGVQSLDEWASPAILFGERPQVCRSADGEVVHNLWGVGFYSPSMPTFAALTPANPPGLWSTGQIAPAGEGLVRVGRADAAPQPIDFPAPFQVLRAGQPCDPRLPGTPHRAGMQVAMSDGSVRVFAPGADPWVFWTACAGPSTAVKP